MVEISILKTLTNCSDDSLLTTLRNECMDHAKEYCNLSAYENKLDYVIQQMVCERYNKLYSDGLNSKSYSGINESYLDDYSPKIYKSLRKFRKLRNVQ